MQATKPASLDVKQYEMRPEGAMWQLSEPRDIYRKTPMGRPGQVTPRYQPYVLPRYQFTSRDLDRCLYGKQDLQVVHIDQKSIEGNPEDKPAKWCDMCQEIHFGDCPSHGPLHLQRPSITLPVTQKSYAISTFPDEVGLCISSLPFAGFGVFARHFIPLGTWIGPYEGRKLSVEEGLSRPQQQNFMWEIYESGRLNCFLDASDENVSSWMRFIQCARHKGEQNLYIFQYYGSIYYRAFKDIPVRTELMVWYDEKYPHFFGLPTEIRDMSSCSVESIQAPVEVASKLAEADPAKTSNPGTPVMRHPSAGPPKTFPDQFRGGIPKVSPQPLTIHGQIPSSSSSKGGHLPVHPPMLSQAPGLQAYDARVTVATPAKSFPNNRLPPSHDNRSLYQAQTALTISVHHTSSGYMQVTGVAPSVRPSASSSQSYLSKPSVLPPPTMSREFPEEKPQQGGWEVWKCTNCGKVFSDRHQFQGHSCLPDIQRQYNYERGPPQANDVHADSQEKPYKCGICAQLFATSVNLSSHMRMHGVEKLFDCQNCGKTFAHAAALNRHKKTPGECKK